MGVWYKARTVALIAIPAAKQSTPVAKSCIEIADASVVATMVNNVRWAS